MRGTKHRVLQAIILIVLCTVFLVGCVQSDIHVKVNPDGSGDLGYSILVNPSLLGGDGGYNPLDDLKANAEQSGFTVTSLEQDGMIGFQASKQVKSIAKESSSDLFLGKIGEGFTQKSSYLKNTYTLNTAIDLSDLSFTGNDKVNPLLQAALKQVKLTLTVDLPVSAAKHNATTIAKNGKELTWVLQPGQVNQINIVAEQYNTTTISLLGVAGLLVIGGISVAISQIKKQTIAMTATEQATTAPETPAVEASTAEQVGETTNVEANAETVAEVAVGVEPNPSDDSTENKQG
ncbi:DUF3153 domain-containing protein [Heliobacterium mobile]|uniref:DUF3153 domain-containing protein n=1 Tax=Heliobacterium mobile TaxID=28064 RepID=UPI0014781DC3|nr:DUF3153 domain-containing protein [Heliobacterium mobile]